MIAKVICAGSLYRVTRKCKYWLALKLAVFSPANTLLGRILK